MKNIFQGMEKQRHYKKKQSNSLSADKRNLLREKENDTRGELRNIQSKGKVISGHV